MVKTDLGAREDMPDPECDLAVFALPVFAGRIPAFTAKKIRALKGSGKKAVTLAVYGVRAYEDALLELNNAVEAAGFCVIASGAVVAQHSIVPAVGQGRPDKADEDSVAAFAQKVMEKLEQGGETPVSVPGNYPYKEMKPSSAAPVCLPECSKCGKCIAVCPVNAMKMEEIGVATDAEACILCMACTAVCPKKARVLPPPLQSVMDEKLLPLVTVRRENEYYL